MGLMMQRWLTQLKWTCSILGVPCDTYIDKDLGVCPSKWSPLTIAVTASIFLTLLLLFLTVSFRHFYTYACLFPVESLPAGSHSCSCFAFHPTCPPFQSDSQCQKGLYDHSAMLAQFIFVTVIIECRPARAVGCQVIVEAQWRQLQQQLLRSCIKQTLSCTLVHLMPGASSQQTSCMHLCCVLLVMKEYCLRKTSR